MKGGGGQIDPHTPEETTLKKPSLIRFKEITVMTFCPAFQKAQLKNFVAFT